MERFIIISIILSFVLFSCTSDVDTEPPVLNIVSFSPALQSGNLCGVVEDFIPILGGDTLIVEAHITDNDNLSQYKLDIHNNFDCHGHSGSVGLNLVLPSTDNQTIDWTVLDIEEISGKEQSLTFYLEAPDNVTTGLYHFQIQAIDISGNDVPLANFYNLQLKNKNDTIPPEIQLSQPTSTTLSVNRGDPIRFAGTVTDNYSLYNGGNGVLFLSYRDENSGNSFLSDNVFQITEESTSYSFDFDFIVPNTFTSGNYTLFVSAFDGVRNIAEAKTVAITVN